MVCGRQALHSCNPSSMAGIHDAFTLASTCKRAGSINERDPLMKFAHKHLTALALVTLSLAASAQTAPPAAGAAPATTTTTREGHGRMDPAKMQEHVAKRLETLKQKLQLSSGQEAGWIAYVAALKPSPVQRPDRAEFAKLSTPERIDRMRELRVTRMAELDKRGDATKTFYATLSSDQKKVFDDETAAREHHGMGGHHHMG
jgi:periplasmic protein CpxP/Spy